MSTFSRLFLILISGKIMPVSEAESYSRKTEKKNKSRLGK